VIDAYSRLVIGHVIADHLRTELAIDAFDVANWRRRPTSGTISHSHHGSQYVAWAFGRRLRKAGLLPSMGSVGDALAHAMFEWIEVVYNRQRRHSTLNYQTPVDYDRNRPTAPAVEAFRLARDVLGDDLV